MTIKMPPKNILDKILALFGKERDITEPENTGEIYKKFGHHVYIKTKRSSK